MDCNQNGSINAEEIFTALKNMKLDYPLKTAMINDFVLKSMEHNSASLDKADFTFAVLVGMYERVIDAH